MLKGLSFPVKMTTNGRLKTTQGADRIASSMSLLFSQNGGDRPYSPTNGVNIFKYVFEDVGPFEAGNVRREITLAVARHEPRATLVNVFTGVRVEDGERVFDVVPVWSFDGKMFAGLYSRSAN